MPIAKGAGAISDDAQLCGSVQAMIATGYCLGKIASGRVEPDLGMRAICGGR